MNRRQFLGAAAAVHSLGVAESEDSSPSSRDAAAERDLLSPSRTTHSPEIAGATAHLEVHDADVEVASYPTQEDAEVSLALETGPIRAGCCVGVDKARELAAEILAHADRAERGRAVYEQRRRAVRGGQGHE